MICDYDDDGDDDDVRSFVYFQTFLIQISVISIQLTTKVTKVLISDVLFRICKKKVSTWFDCFLSFWFFFLICTVEMYVMHFLCTSK